MTALFDYKLGSFFIEFPKLCLPVYVYDQIGVSTPPAPAVGDGDLGDP